MKWKMPGKKIFLLGYSMGGLTACLLLQKYPGLADYLILDAPFLGLPNQVPQWQLNLVHFVGSKSGLGAIPVSKMDGDLLCRDKDIVAQFTNDQLAYKGSTTARTASLTTKALEEASKGVGSMTVPVLALHGTDDRVAPIDATRLFVEKMAASDKTFKPIDEGFHNLRYETHKNIKSTYFNIVEEWVDKRIN